MYLGVQKASMLRQKTHLYFVRVTHDTNVSWQENNFTMHDWEKNVSAQLRVQSSWVSLIALSRGLAMFPK